MSAAGLDNVRFEARLLLGHAAGLSVEQMVARGADTAPAGVVGAHARAYWGAYGASKAALDNLVTAYGEEVKNISEVRAYIVDPARTRTDMRAKAYPGEDPATVKEPSVVADAIAQLLASDMPTGHRMVLEG